MDEHTAAVKWEVISRDDNYIQIAREGITVAHVLTAPAIDASGRKNAADIVRACNAHDSLAAACETMRTELAHLGKYDPHLEDNFVLPAVLDQADAAIALATEADDNSEPTTPQWVLDARKRDTALPQGPPTRGRSKLFKT